ncbi:MAG: tetratricopeptide repeat protein [Ignavibacteriales bacterium]|nr:tetratricopeptide repeat protein [Ignavibacteriales bacterium]
MNDIHELVKAKMDSTSVWKTAAQLLVFACLVLLPGVPAQSQTPQRKSFEQNRFESSGPVRDLTMADAHYRLGLENMHEPSNSDRAIEHLEKAVELDKANGEYHYMLAEAYMANFQSAGLVRMPFLAPKVKAQLELAVQCDPGSTAYREALVNYYVYAPGILGGGYQKAHEQAAEISKIDSYLGMLAHAGVYAGEGESERAADLYKKAIYSRPASWQAYHHFGNYYLDLGEIDAAITMFKKYVEVAPDQAESHYQLGRAYQQKRMYAETITAFQNALGKDPSRTPLVFRIAQLHEFMGSKALAREQYQRYLSMVPSGRAADDARVKIRELPH